MAVTVTSAASTKQLTTTALVKEDLGISGSTYDTIIGHKIDQASAVVERICRQVFARQVYSETLKGNGSHILMLDRTPIVSVASVSFKGVALDSSAYNIEDAEAGFLFSDIGWNDTAYRTFGVSQLPEDSSRKAEYTVAYTAGYWLPGMAGEAVAPILPDDLEFAARELAKMYFAARKRDASVKSESASNVGSVTYHGDGTAGSGVPPLIMDALRPWIRTTV